MDKITQPKDDVKFSKVGVVVPSCILFLETKKASTSASAEIVLVSILDKCVVGYPSIFWTGQGSDFQGELQTFWKDLGNHQYNT